MIKLVGTGEAAPFCGLANRQSRRSRDHQPDPSGITAHLDLVSCASDSIKRLAAIGDQAEIGQNCARINLRVRPSRAANGSTTTEPDTGAVQLHHTLIHG